MSAPVDDAPRISMISYGLPAQTTSRLFDTWQAGLERHGNSVDRASRSLPRGLFKKVLALVLFQMQTMRQIARNDMLIVHTPLAVSVLSVMTARATGSAVVACVWDIYPESTTHIGRRRSRLATAVYWLLERIAMALASTIVVPSRDYVAPIARWRSKISVLPLWPCDPILSSSSETHRDEALLKVAFAGQINGIRSLASGAGTLLSSWTGPIELHLFSSDSSPVDLLDLAAENVRLTVTHHGSLPADQLQDQLSQLDVGWVSLDPDFMMPAFPSKSLAYIAAGIPVWFNGPDLPAYRQWLTEAELGICIDELSEPLDPELFDAFCYGFTQRRDSYLHFMESRWFSLETLH